MCGEKMIMIFKKSKRKNREQKGGGNFCMGPKMECF